MTGEAAIAATWAASQGVPTSSIDVEDIQARLREVKVWLGTPGEEVPDLLKQAS